MDSSNVACIGAERGKRQWKVRIPAGSTTTIDTTTPCRVYVVLDRQNLYQNKINLSVLTTLKFWILAANHDYVISAQVKKYVRYNKKGGTHESFLLLEAKNLRPYTSIPNSFSLYQNITKNHCTNMHSVWNIGRWNISKQNSWHT